MTAAEHARQVERVKASLLLGIRPPKPEPKPEHDTQPAIRGGGGFRY
jgi:hypothetical protein